jgi:prolyl-tRNA synthetase
MRWTRTLIPTLRKAPEGAEAASHVFLLRSGAMAQVTSGSYAYLPLGLRVVRKAKEVVRREVEAAGAVEVAMPALSPASFWEQSGRGDDFGDELIEIMLRRQNRKARVVLAPGHEEVAADLVSRFVSSYRQLPIRLYQLQAKFRNEERPRFGLLRTNEFLTVDAYSFDRSAEALDKSYEAIRAAFGRILDRLGLEYLLAEADTGPVSRDAGGELLVLAERGEHLVAHCPDCGYAAGLERAEIGPLGTDPPDVPMEPLRQVDTPDATTIEQVSNLLGCQPTEMIKTLIYTADGKPIAVLVRGDHEASEAKVRRAVGARKLELAPREVIERVTGAPVGFAGPVGLKENIPIWADRSVRGMRNAVTGANRADAHLTGVNTDRDFQAHEFADLRVALEGDPCPRCSSRLTIHRAIEVGRVANLGADYSEALGARFDDEHEQQHPIEMGSYQLGIDRLIAAVVETSHDERGIVWPVSLAPYEVLVMPLNVTEPETLDAAERLYDDLGALGIDVLLDDRDQRAGVKFYDADLVGVPLRVVLGPRRVKEGKLEIKWRWDAQPKVIELEGAACRIAELIGQERETGARLKTWQTSPQEGNA